MEQEAPPEGGEEELDEVGKLTAQVSEWKETAVRATADLDNYRKRMAREKTDLLRYGNQSLLEELLPGIRREVARLDRTVAEFLDLGRPRPLCYSSLPDFQAV